MNLQCEQCGETSPGGSQSCVKCGTSYAFLSRPSSEWTPDQYSAWLYSEHFQICQLAYAAGVESLSRSNQLNYLVGYLYYQVSNGGIWQYFANPCGPDAPLLVAALREINADEIADLVSECLTYFPNGQPQPEMDDRDESIDLIPEDTQDQLHDQIASCMFDRRDGLDILLLLRKGVESANSSTN